MHQSNSVTEVTGPDGVKRYVADEEYDLWSAKEDLHMRGELKRIPTHLHEELGKFFTWGGIEVRHFLYLYYSECAVNWRNLYRYEHWERLIEEKYLSDALRCIAKPKKELTEAERLNVAIHLLMFSRAVSAVGRRVICGSFGRREEKAEGSLFKDGSYRPIKIDEYDKVSEEEGAKELIAEFVSDPGVDVNPKIFIAPLLKILSKWKTGSPKSPLAKEFQWLSEQASLPVGDGESAIHPLTRVKSLIGRADEVWDKEYYLPDRELRAAFQIGNASSLELGLELGLVSIDMIVKGMANHRGPMLSTMSKKHIDLYTWVFNKYAKEFLSLNTASLITFVSRIKEKTPYRDDIRAMAEGFRLHKADAKISQNMTSCREYLESVSNRQEGLTDGQRYLLDCLISQEEEHVLQLTVAVAKPGQVGTEKAKSL